MVARCRVLTKLRIKRSLHNYLIMQMGFVARCRVLNQFCLRKTDS